MRKRRPRLAVLGLLWGCLGAALRLLCGRSWVSSCFVLFSVGFHSGGAAKGGEGCASGGRVVVFLSLFLMCSVGFRCGGAARDGEGCASGGRDWSRCGVLVLRFHVGLSSCCPFLAVLVFVWFSLRWRGERRRGMRKRRPGLVQLWCSCPSFSRWSFFMLPCFGGVGFRLVFIAGARRGTTRDAQAAAATCACACACAGVHVCVCVCVRTCFESR